MVVGKTSLVNRYIHGKYNEDVDSTIACEYSLKMIEVGNVSLRLNLWDICGQDRLGGNTAMFMH